LVRTLYVVHHSHTDVGYTDLQSVVARRHADFVLQALHILSDPALAAAEEHGRFRWTCETFWSVERFIDLASSEEAASFERAVKNGDIGLSGSYLNMNELAGYELLSRLLGRAAEYGRSMGVPVDSAMTADINGYSWGFAQALVDNGIENLLTCIHTHHGTYPLGRQQVAFWWKAPRCGRVLVWSGEHYHLGNEFGIAPGAVSSYLIKDECDEEMIFGDSWKVALIRIPRYLEKLRSDGYTLDFAPVMVSGLRTDNAPPSGQIIAFIRRWNAEQAAVCRLEMTTPSAFFARVREASPELPEHSGDWPDWWSDGHAADAVSTSLFREAQRNYETCLRLPGIGTDTLRADTRPLEDALALYAEHTFGHADSVRTPWNIVAQGIGERKRSYAALAFDEARALLVEALASLGAAGMEVGTPLAYRVINATGHATSGIAELAVGHHELNELGLSRGATVLDAEAGIDLPCQPRDVPGGVAFCSHVELEAGEERTLLLRPESPRAREPSVCGPPEAVSEDEGRARDHTRTSVGGASGQALETPFVRIEWREGEGIVRWLDRALGRDLLRRDRRHNAFTPVYELTPEPEAEGMCAVRGRMGLNRKGRDARRTAGRLECAHSMHTGDIFAHVELDFELPGVHWFVLSLDAYMDEPRVDVAARIHKESVWQPENLYLSLPYDTGSECSTLWLEKPGASVRPRVDQLPGTLTDYYCVQSGLALVSEDCGLALATPDSPLVQVGPLGFGARRLMGDPALRADPAHLYAWLMTNFWETNFAAETGGFYEFRFSVAWDESFRDESAALDACRAMASGMTCFRLADGV
jgi:hypothetical protein